MVCDEPSTGWTLNVKSPRSPAKPEISKLYVPAAGSVCTTTSGLVPVSTCWMTFPAGSLSVRMKSVDPEGIASTIARIVCPAVPVNGSLAIGCAAVISPVVSISGSPSGAPLASTGSSHCRSRMPSEPPSSDVGSPPRTMLCAMSWPGPGSKSWKPPA